MAIASVCRTDTQAVNTGGSTPSPSTNLTGNKVIRVITNGLVVTGVRWKLGRKDGLIPSYRTILRKDPCTYCGKFPRKLVQRTVEHIQPRSLQGKDGWTNLASACCGCNQHRGNAPLLWFILESRLRNRRFIGGVK